MLAHRIIGLVALSLMPAIAIQGYNEFALRDARGDAVRRVSQTSARGITNNLAQFAEGGRHVLTLLSLDPAVASGDAASCSEHLQVRAERIPGATIIARADRSGKVACSSLGADRTGYSVADRAYFKAAQADGSFAVGEYLLGRGTDKPTLQLVLPLSSRNGRPDGVIYMGFDPSWVASHLAQSGLPPRANLLVADRNGVILVLRPDPDGWTGRTLPEDFRARLESAVDGAAEMTGLRGTQRIFGAVRPDGPLSGMTVAVGLDRAQAYADIDAASRRGLILLILGAAVAAIVGILASRFTVHRPVTRLMAVAKAWQNGDLTVRNGVRDRSEFGQLGGAFDAMADALQARDGELRSEIARGRDLQQQQVEMLHELNHRVKNTLATVQSLARQSRGGDEQAAQLERRILALSRTHDLLVRDDWSGASWREVLDNEFDPYTGSVARFALEGPDVELSPRHVLALGMTVHELATNAAKYGALSRPEGRVEVSWTAAAGRLRVSWTEHAGPPVAEPARKGFGLRLIQGGARELDGSVRLDFAPDGLRCHIDVPLPAPRPPEALHPHWSSLGPARPAA